MTNQEMLTIVKMRGWRLRSKRGGMNPNGRLWYVVDASDVPVVSPRYRKDVALSWAVALITKDAEKQAWLRLLDLEPVREEFRRMYESTS